MDSFLLGEEGRIVGGIYMLHDTLPSFYCSMIIIPHFLSFVKKMFVFVKRFSRCFKLQFIGAAAASFAFSMSCRKRPKVSPQVTDEV